MQCINPGPKEMGTEKLLLESTYVMLLQNSITTNYEFVCGLIKWKIS